MDAVTKATAQAFGPHQQVEAGFAAYVGYMVDHPQSFPLLFGGASRRDPEFAEAVARAEDAMAEGVAALIEADIDETHRRVLGYAVVGMAEGVLRHWETERPDIPPETLVRQMAELAWAGLRGVRRL